MIILHLCRGPHSPVLLRLPRDNLCTQAAINTQCREDGEIGIAIVNGSYVLTR